MLARALVDQPDAVQVTEIEHRGMTLVELTTAPGDMGKIIGRQGRTAAALRTLVASTAREARASASRSRSGIDGRWTSDAMTDWDDMALVGRIARPHGIRGQVIVNPETDFPEERFRAGRRRLDAIATGGRAR